MEFARKQRLWRRRQKEVPKRVLWGLQPVDLQIFTWCKRKLYKVNSLVACAGSCLSIQMAGGESLKFKHNKANMADIKAFLLCHHITWHRSHKSRSCSVQTLWLRPPFSNSITWLLPVRVTTGAGMIRSRWAPSVGSSAILSLQMFCNAVLLNKAIIINPCCN